MNAGSIGFPIDGQMYTFDVGLPDSEGGSHGTYVPGVDVSAGYVDANGKPKDVTAPTRTTLAQYMSKVTMGKEGSTTVPNQYVVDPIGPSIVTISDSKGYPGGLENPPINMNTFAGKNERTIDYRSPVYPTTLANSMKKGKSSINLPDGNDVLAGVSGTTTYVGSPGNLSGDATNDSTPLIGHVDTSQTIVNPYVSAILSSNRFSAAATNVQQFPYASIDISNPSPSFNPSFTNQNKLGLYDKNAGPPITAGRLAAIGPLLTMRAGLELGSNDPGADPNDGGLQAKALLPGLAQLGTSTVDVTTLYASDVLKSLTQDEPSGNDVLSIGAQSWGQLNNTDDPFSGTDALGMLALSTALVAGMMVLFDSLSVILGMITPTIKSPSFDGEGRYTLGEHYPGMASAQKSSQQGGIGGVVASVSTLNFGALLGIVPTNYPFNQALTTGINAFFSIPGGGGIGLNQLAGALTSSTDSPGFNTVVARAIIRSGVTIVDKLKGIGGNPMNVINSILSLIDTIRSSKIVAACNVFAMLGDAQLSLPGGYIDSTVSNTVKVSSMDATPDTLSNAASKNRLQSSLKLAWSSNRSRANLLIPSQILALNSVVTMDQFNPTGASSPESLVNNTVTLPENSGRIDPDTAAQFEATLEAEYVPFYFHDIRTNEMVGFHAFLASLTDDFTASYEKTEGYGRVEPVKIYKGTERRINMSFYIISTSQQDFDEMWIKINKLVTLIYPQYTKGVTLLSQDQSYSFTQPFSQLIGASPLIRIRLGDLIRGNYSQFALARLFGLGNSDFQLDNVQFTDGSSYDQSQLDLLNQAIQDDLFNPQGNTYYVAPGNYPLYQDNSIPFLGSFGGATGPANAPTFDPSVCSIPNMFIAKIKKVSANSNGNAIIEVCEIDINDDPVFTSAFSSAISSAQAQFENGDPLQTIVGGTYSIPLDALIPTPQTKRKLMQQVAPGSSGTSFASTLTNFIDPSNNAIAKSFKDTYGKGLAGFIETMNFDWYDKVTWETSVQGRIAPKMCKVTLGFSPIHDISPGIDHMGYNRAPVYGVGVMGSPNASFPTNIQPSNN